jgi:hypothetical protein
MGHWLAVEGGYYLVELTMTPTNEHLYMWVSSDAKEATFFVGFMENAELADVADGSFRFFCNRVADSFSVFPYYEVAKTGGEPEQAPFFKVPNADMYATSTPGLGYELRKAASSGMSLDLLFMITGADPDGVMAGGSRPPAGRITESGGSITVRLWYVTLGPGTEEAIRAFSSTAAVLKSVSYNDGCLELEFAVPWAYSVSLIGEKAEPKPGDKGQALNGYRLSFLPRPETPDPKASLNQVATTITGMRFGNTTVTAPRLLGELQKYLLRAFPLQPEPSGATGAVDTALLTSGRWESQKQAYVAGAQGVPSYVRWQDRWYELDPGFDALLKTASLADRDAMGETPDAVVKRYLLALFYKDWKGAYECLGSVPKHLTQSEYGEQAKRPREYGVGYRTDGYEMMQQDVATVSVSAERWGGSGAPSSWKESWTCIRENGLWKLRWQPKQ